VGAGIEKKQDDFVAEVMAQVKEPLTEAGRLLKKNPALARGFFTKTHRLTGSRAEVRHRMNDAPKRASPGSSSKLSGEGAARVADYGVDPAILKRIAGELQDIIAMGGQTAVVIGGGNIFRGAGLARAGMDRVAADHMGMLATVMNSLAMQDALEALGMHARVMSAIRINEVCEDYIRRRAVRHLEKGRVVIFRGGYGQPFLYDRYGRVRCARSNQRRRAAEGDQGERCLFRKRCRYGIRPPSVTPR